MRRFVRREFHFRWNMPPDSFRSEYAQWHRQRHAARRWGVLGRALKRWMDPGDRLVHDAIGAVSFYSDLYVYDRNGLTCREVALREGATPRRRSPGHDKTVELEFFVGDARFAPTVLRSRLIEGPAALPPGGAARRAVVQQVAAWQAELRRRGLDGEFITDFRPVPDWEYGGPFQHLFVWRRLREGAGRELETRELERRLAEFRRGVDPYRDEVELGWPEPPAHVVVPRRSR